MSTLEYPHLKRIRFISLATLTVALTLALSVPAVFARKNQSLVERVVNAYASTHSFEVPATGSLEVAFSPSEGGEALVVKVADSARTELRVLAYSFTSAPVTAALLRAKKRGVDVRLVVDEKNNLSEDRSGKSRAALSALVNAGIDVRTISIYPIHHDKVIVADRETVELGSFNYSDAAARKNSENVLVNWRNPKLAGIYLQHFERNYRQSSRYSEHY
jgi:phosphatidylserine/phosphatidylglycerophosphate/cardiolipin synthase-like enzyme